MATEHGEAARNMVAFGMILWFEVADYASVQNCSPTPSLIFLDTPPPLACLHCAATQATVLRDRQILDARAGYHTQCVCCDCETGSACPKCRGEHLEYGPFDGGTDPLSGYADSGERYYCRDCGATGDVDGTLACTGDVAATGASGHTAC